MAIHIETSAIPLLPNTRELARAGYTTGGGTSNLRYVDPWLQHREGFDPIDLAVLTDPQTSGGLCIAVAEAFADQLCNLLSEQGVGTVAVIGSIESGPASLVLR